MFVNAGYERWKKRVNEWRSDGSEEPYIFILVMVIDRIKKINPKSIDSVIKVVGSTTSTQKTLPEPVNLDEVFLTMKYCIIHSCYLFAQTFGSMSKLFNNRLFFTHSTFSIDFSPDLFSKMSLFVIISIALLALFITFIVVVVIMYMSSQSKIDVRMFSISLVFRKNWKNMRPY